MVTQKKTIIRKKAVPAKNKERASSGIKIPTFNAKGEAQAEVVFPKSLQQKASPHLIAQAYRVYRQNARQGTTATKTRGEVKGSSRKIYRQKGTGRARHGSIRAPIFVGGGVVFGPKPRNLSARINKKMKQRAFLGLLNDKIAQKKFMVIAGLSENSGKTKEAAGFLKKLNVYGNKTILVTSPNFKKFTQSARNVKHLNLRSLHNLSSLDLMTHEYLLMAKESFAEFVAKKLT